MKKKVRVVLTIPQWRAAEEALRACNLRGGMRMMLDRDELRELLAEMRGRGPKVSDSIRAYITWGALYDKLAAALKKASAE